MSKAMNVIKKCDKVMEAISRYAAYIAAAALVFNMLIVVIYVVTRALNIPIVGVEEVVSFGQIVVIAMAIAYTHFNHGLVHVGFFMKKLPKFGPMIAWVIDTYIAAVVSIFWAMQSVQHISAVRNFSQILKFPWKPLYIAMTVGVCIYCISQVYEAIRVTVGAFDKEVREDIITNWPA